MFSGSLQRAYPETSDADIEELVQILAAGQPATPNSGEQTSVEVGDKPNNKS
jgi:hypothetical protein